MFLRTWNIYCKQCEGEIVIRILFVFYLSINDLFVWWDRFIPVVILVIVFVLYDFKSKHSLLMFVSSLFTSNPNDIFFHFTFLYSTFTYVYSNIYSPTKIHVYYTVHLSQSCVSFNYSYFHCICFFSYLTILSNS